MQFASTSKPAIAAIIRAGRACEVLDELVLWHASEDLPARLASTQIWTSLHLP